MPSRLPMFQIIFDALKIAGVFVDETCRWKFYLFKFYGYLTILIGVYGLVAFIRAGLTSNNASLFIMLGCLQVWVLIDSVYFLVKEDEIRELLDTIVELNKMFDNNQLLHGCFTQQASRVLERIQLYIKAYLISQSLLPVLNGLFKIFRYLRIFGLDGEVTYVISPLHDHDIIQHYSLFFMIDLTLLVLVFTYECLKQSVSNCFFMCMILQMNLYFEHLNHSFTEIFNTPNTNYNSPSSLVIMRIRNNINSVLKTIEWLHHFGDGSTNLQELPSFDLKGAMQQQENERITTWAIMHQEVLRLTQKLIILYNPMLMVQFSFIFFLSVILIFMVTTQKGIDVMEKAVCAMYCAMVMSVFYAMCMVGELLSYNSTRVCRRILPSPWYLSDKGTGKSLLIIGERSRKPLRITVFSSDAFNLSTSTFLWIMKSVITAYIALMQINDSRLSIS